MISASDVRIERDRSCRPTLSNPVDWKENMVQELQITSFRLGVKRKWTLLFTSLCFRKLVQRDSKVALMTVKHQSETRNVKGQLASTPLIMYGRPNNPDRTERNLLMDVKNVFEEFSEF